MVATWSQSVCILHKKPNPKSTENSGSLSINFPGMWIRSKDCEMLIDTFLLKFLYFSQNFRFFCYRSISQTGGYFLLSRWAQKISRWGAKHSGNWQLQPDCSHTHNHHSSVPGTHCQFPSPGIATNFPVGNCCWQWELAAIDEKGSDGSWSSGAWETRPQVKQRLKYRGYESAQCCTNGW